ncbi:hypothetical protein CHS0354_027257 [Potamilus streckersoni]|uniref:Uncharacterized protein n=1 Tax=Potamilus streckersoni TaxID=2493646 RepID=A0AAE0VKZ9_9BIVA|nr:hypothetical protein CHS0354_027257 [Potamilus streckersoni]
MSQVCNESLYLSAKRNGEIHAVLLAALTIKIKTTSAALQQQKDNLKSEKGTIKTDKAPKPPNQYNPKAACTRRSSRRKSSSPNYLRGSTEKISFIA